MAIDTIQTEIDRIGAGKETLRCAINKQCADRGQVISAGTLIDNSTWTDIYKASTDAVFYPKTGTSGTATDTIYYTSYTGMSASLSYAAVTLSSTVALPNATMMYYFYKLKCATGTRMYGFYINGERALTNIPYFLGTIVSSTGSTTRSTDVYGIVKQEVTSSIIYDVLYIGTNSNTMNLPVTSSYSNFGGIAFTTPIVVVGGISGSITAGSRSVGSTASTTVNGYSTYASKTLSTSTSATTFGCGKNYSGFVLPKGVENALTNTVVLTGISTLRPTATGSGSFDTTTLQKLSLVKSMTIWVGDPYNGYYKYSIRGDATTWANLIYYTAGTYSASYGTLGYPNVDGTVKQLKVPGSSSTDYVELYNVGSSSGTGVYLMRDGVKVNGGTAIIDGDVYYASNAAQVTIN